MATKKKKRPIPPPAPIRSAPPRAKAAAGPTPRELERAAARKAAAREGLRRKLVIGALVLAAVAAVGTYVVVDRRGDAALNDALTGGSCTVDTEADPTSGAPNNHVPNPTYRVDPPAGGNHLGTGTASSGIYGGNSVPADGLLVHSLEHGYVVLWHAPGLAAGAMEQLAAIQRESGKDVIVAERGSMTVPVAATAWGQRLLCGQVEPDVLRRFVTERVGDGPEDVPRT